MNENWPMRNRLFAFLGSVVAATTAIALSGGPVAAKAPPVGGEQTTGKSYLEFLERAGGGVVGGYNNFWLAGGTQLISVDGQKRSSLVVDPPDGKIPPMKPEARQRNARFAAGDAAELFLQQPEADRADEGHRHPAERDGPRRARRAHERGARAGDDPQ